MSADELLPAPNALLPTVLCAHARRRSAALALGVLQPSRVSVVAVPYTNGDLDHAIGHAAARLRAAGVEHGDRVLVALGRPEHFAAFVLGAMRIGAAAVPVPELGPLEQPAAFTERVHAVARDASPVVAVVADRPAGERLAAVGIASMLAAERDRLGLGAAIDSWQEVAPSDTALLQYTSGSTGDPKGVVVSHANLAANLRAIALAARFGPDERSVSWLPLHHDMGLVGGLLVSLYMGTPAFVMETRHFMARPLAWLHAIDACRATFTVAPNFAYNLVAHRVPPAALDGLDLSSLRLAFNGAEPIDRDTIEAFAERLAPHGLRRNAMFPVYGMAECTLATAFSTPEASPDIDVIDSRDTLERAPRGTGLVGARRGRRRARAPRSRDPRRRTRQRRAAGRARSR